MHDGVHREEYHHNGGRTMKTMMLVMAAVATGMLAGGCDDSMTTEPTSSTLKINTTGLMDLGSTAQYEGWVIVNGTPKSTGTFTVNSAGVASRTEFSVAQADLAAATEFVLTVEPKPDSDPMPSKQKLLAGTFNGASATLSVGHMAALGNPFTSAAGRYILATPTDGNMDMNEKSGVWFLEMVGGQPMKSLELPTLPEGWKYEGWGVINGVPLSTGTFTSTMGADQAKPFSGPVAGPPFPGEDFLTNAPAGVALPTDLSSKEIVITIEPSPDNSPMPFMLKPLSGMVPAGAMDHTPYMLSNKASMFPGGTVTR
jgi:hypothetical protein